VTDPGLGARLEALVRSSDWLMGVLRAARDVDPPDWLVGGGVLRDLVWDRLHGRAEPGPSRDVDLAFYDPGRLDAGRDAEVERALAVRLAGVPWDAKNQASVHHWYGRVFGAEVEPLASTADGVGTWPETATAVAVRLLDGDPAAGGRALRPGGPVHAGLPAQPPEGERRALPPPGARQAGRRALAEGHRRRSVTRAAALRPRTAVFDVAASR
jgi:hypothetical protein